MKLCYLVIGCWLLVVAAASGCAGNRSEARPQARQASEAPTPVSASPNPSRDRPVVLAFGGDVHFEGAIEYRLTDDPDHAIGPIASVLRRADIAMVNLESAVTTGGDPADKAYTFRAPPTAFRALASAGIDVVSMANNHGMDYGVTGLEDSLSAAEDYGFPVVGIGRDAAEAYAPHVETVRDHRIGFIGATQVIDTKLIDDWTATDAEPGLASAKTEDRLVEAVRIADLRVDTLVVYLHWGRELEPCPLEVQRSLAKRLIAAGADVIVGTHAHRLLAGGFVGDSYVHYGVGNFVFYASDSVTAQSGVLTITLTNDRVARARWAPAAISDGVPRLLSGEEARKARRTWIGLRRCADVAPRGGP